jgi:cell division protease FtsH
MSFNKIKASFGSGDDNKGRFADVAGADMEKTELLEIVDFLKDSRSYVKMGAKIPKGVLLVGPPGTGKTLLARAVAGEAGVPFLSISGSEFMEMFVGVGASRIRDLFEQAEKNSPCIIFIDEIDAVGRHRGAGLGGGHDEREQTLNQLLVEMDGFNVNKGIIVMAATNRADILDPALLRPGRFDRQITVSLPTVNARHEILKVHAKNKPLTNEVDLKAIAERTTGFSGADLASVLNEAALLAARFNKSAITTSEIDEAIDRVLMGPAKKGMVVSSNELKMIAYHEAGHVVLGYYLGEDAVVHKVTIVPRKDAAGYAMIGPKEDRIITTKRELLNQITGLLGGRVAEKLVFNESSTGASKDFEMATGIARAMITEYGMSDKLATMLYGDTREQVFLGRDLGSRKNCSDQIAYEIDMEMQQIMRDCYRAAETLIKKHRNKLDLIATELLARETLVREQIIELMKYGKLAVTDEKNTKEKNKDDLDDVKVNIQKKDIKELDEQANKDDNK